MVCLLLNIASNGSAHRSMPGFWIDVSPGMMPASMNRATACATAAGWSRCGEWPQAGNLSSSLWAARRRLRRSAPWCRTRRRCPGSRAPGSAMSPSRSLDVPVPESRGQPDVVPAPEGGVGVGVMASQLARAGRWSCSRPAPSRCWRPRCPRRRCAARPPRCPPRAAEAAPHGSARSSRRRCGREPGPSAPHDAERVEEGRQEVARLVMHEVHATARASGAGSSGRSPSARTPAAAAGRLADAATGSPATSPPSPALRGGTRQRRSRRCGAIQHARSARAAAFQATSTNSLACPIMPCPRVRLALAQPEPLDLAGRRLRQLVDELDAARVLVRRQPP